MNSTTALHTLTVGEMRIGDIVHAEGGLRCLVDRAPRLSTAHAGGRTYRTDALVLNRDEVSADSVPMSFTRRTPEGDARRGTLPEYRVTQPEHRWGLQGNDLALYSVER